MKIFVSSLITGMESFRASARRAIRNLGHEPIMAEDFGAHADSPQKLCLKGVMGADAVVALVGANYGERQASGLSATHEELKEAHDRGRPVLTMVQTGVDREPAQRALLNDLQSWASGTFTADFGSPDQLLDKLSGALHKLDLSRATGPTDPKEMLERALSALPEHKRGYSREPTLELSLACGPLQSVLRPAQLESQEFAEKVQQAALFGKGAVLLRSHGTETEFEADRLVLTQDERTLAISETGSVAFTAHLIIESGFSAIIEESVQDLTQRFLFFASSVLTEIDPIERLTHVMIVANISGAEHSIWRTQDEHAKSPSSMQMPMNSRDPEPVDLSPPRTRSMLKFDSSALASDLTVKLRRQFRDGRRR